MQQVSLELSGGLLIAVLPEGRFVLDTGSPASFATTGQVTFGTQTTRIPQQFGGVGIEHVRVLVPGPCEGLLGMDRLGAERLLLDVAGGTLKVGEQAWDGIPDAQRRGIDVRSVMGGTPVVSITAGGLRVDAIFDTGSRYSYAIDPRLVAGGEPQPDLDDFNPILGHLRSPSWAVDIALNGEAALHWRDRMAVMQTQQAGPLAHIAQALGVSALVGNAWMGNRRVGLDMRQHGSGTLWTC